MNPINGSTILVTGGTGSFGNEVVRKLLPLKPKQVLIFSRDEMKQHVMRSAFDDSRLSFVIGDVRDRRRVHEVFNSYKITYVFHAAALKQVPSCEFFPLEAVKTNVLGAANVIDEAISHKVKRVVVLSTDKSVYPINAMGMTKALMEKVMVARAKSLAAVGTISSSVCAVRYGNVMCTRGSVVPYFLEQMKHSKPLTVTSGDMTRFLLPLQDAVELVLHSLEHGKNGYIYVKKSDAASMATLASALCDLYNYEPGYVEVGVRPGEKMHETLVTSEEMMRAHSSASYFQIPPESATLSYDDYFDPEKGMSKSLPLAFTSKNTKQLSVAATKKLLKACIGAM